MTKSGRIFVASVLVLLVIVEIVLFAIGESQFIKTLVACALVLVGSIGALVNIKWKSVK